MNKKCWAALLMTALLLIMAAPALAVHEELGDGKYYTLVDEHDQIILYTAMQVYVGDEYISADNSRYKIQEISQNKARCALVGKELMPQVSFDENKQAWMLDDEVIPAAAAAQQKRIALYSTHSDESYNPSDGTSSKEGAGGVYDVGDALASKLQALGFKVDFNKNNHNPHDVNAYNRSRRTAATLLRSNPDAIVDVHRDAVPASQYQANIRGEEVTKIKLVVGRQNPNQASTLDFAKRLKAVMDQKTPGLSNGIFMGKGDYNQDLSPRAILIEVGSNTNSKEAAEKGVQLFAESLPLVLGASTSAQNGPGTPAQKPLSGSNRSSWTNILILLAVLGAAGAGFYYLNRGKAKE